MEIIMMTVTLITGLMAGLYLGWAISVLPGFWLLEDRAMLLVFQQVNRAILNTAFKTLFTTAAFAAPATLALYWSRFSDADRYMMILISMLLIVGHFLVTFLGNIPINQRLDKLDINAATQSEVVTMRERLKVNWRRLHWTRTIATNIAFVLLLVLISDFHYAVIQAF